MSKMKLKTALQTLGHTQALKDGTIRPETFDFEFEEVPQIIQAFRRMVRGLEFDISEMAITTYLCAKAHGKKFTAIPVFPYRAFHHGAIVTNTKLGITHPKQLEGKRQDGEGGKGKGNGGGKGKGKGGYHQGKGNKGGIPMGGGGRGHRSGGQGKGGKGRGGGKGNPNTEGILRAQMAAMQARELQMMAVVRAAQAAPASLTEGEEWLQRNVGMTSGFRGNLFIGGTHTHGVP